MNKKNLLLASVLAIIFTSILIIFSPSSQKTSQHTPTPSPISTKSISPTLDPTTDWKSFRDDNLKIQFKYPNQYKLDITRDGNYYGVYLKGSNFRTESNDLAGVVNLGTFFVFSDSKICEAAPALELETLISKNNNFSFYKIKGIEGPDYKVALIKKSSNGCIHFVCMSDNLCEGTELTDFQSILSTLKFTP